MLHAAPPSLEAALLELVGNHKLSALPKVAQVLKDREDSAEPVPLVASAAAPVLPTTAGAGVISSAAHQPYPLSEGKEFHFFICHHQGSGGDQSMNLCTRLQQLGCRVWYDNGQSAEHRNLTGMKRGVRLSECLLIFLSGAQRPNAFCKDLVASLTAAAFDVACAVYIACVYRSKRDGRAARC